MTLTVNLQTIAPEELVAPRMEISGGNAHFTVQPSVAGRKYQLLASETLAAGTWQNLGDVVTGDGNNLVIGTPLIPGMPRRFYRLALDPSSTAPEGFALIPAGEFQMGQDGIATPVHSVFVSAFYMAKFEVTKEEWDVVRAWGLNNGYTDLAVGNGSYASKGANQPVHSITWYDMVKWCNAHSEMEGLMPCYKIRNKPDPVYYTYKTGEDDYVSCNWTANGYRLPTEAEWEKAARGGVSGKLFPWGTDTISHSQANYFSSTDYSYDVSPTRGYHPTYAVGGYPYSSPVVSFAANGYGLHDMAGNMREWCWDWYGSYPSISQSDPHGPVSGTDRVIRGGGWSNNASYCRVADRYSYVPGGTSNRSGFRLARSAVP